MDSSGKKREALRVSKVYLTPHLKRFSLDYFSPIQDLLTSPLTASSATRALNAAGWGGFVPQPPAEPRSRRGSPASGGVGLVVEQDVPFDPLNIRS